MKCNSNVGELSSRVFFFMSLIKREEIFVCFPHISDADCDVYGWQNAIFILPFLPSSSFLMLETRFNPEVVDYSPPFSVSWELMACSFLPTAAAAIKTRWSLISALISISTLLLFFVGNFVVSNLSILALYHCCSFGSKVIKAVKPRQTWC